MYILTNRIQAKVRMKYFVVPLAFAMPDMCLVVVGGDYCIHFEKVKHAAEINTN